MIRTEQLPEPELIFANGKKCLDPKLGILLYGPAGLSDQEREHGVVIRAGAVGTLDSLSRLHNLLERFRMRVSGGQKGEPWKYDFPGLGIKSALHFDIGLERDAESVITGREEDETLSGDDRLKRIVRAGELYERKFADLVDTSRYPLDIVFFPISRRFMELTKEPGMEGDKIVYARRTMDKTVDLSDVPLFDFHHFLKVLGFKHRIPSQMIRPDTLELTGKIQDDATVAWNFSVAAYYKATDTPWKLADLDDRTCYVGISFYQEMGQEKNMRASMAHVYLQSGESQVIRGKPFKWEGPKGKSPQLTKSQAHDILADVIRLYRDRKKMDPLRMVVHKTSDYSHDEEVGFTNAAEGVESVDLIHIYQQTDLRAFYKSNEYPPLRGTLIYDTNEAPAYLFTTGFTPALGTYKGTVPMPLAFTWQKKASTVRTIAMDIMALTKLDWNSTEFATALPVTISVSKKVGDILSESRAKGIVEPPTAYRYFM